MRSFTIKIRNLAEWMADGAVSVEVMILADDFVTATMKAHEVLDGLRSALAALASENENVKKDLENLRVVTVQETCATVVDGVGVYSESDGVKNAVDRLAKRLAKT